MCVLSGRGPMHRYLVRLRQSLAQAKVKKLTSQKSMSDIRDRTGPIRIFIGNGFPISNGIQITGFNKSDAQVFTHNF